MGQQNSISQGPEHLRADKLEGYELRINPLAPPELTESVGRFDGVTDEQYVVGPPGPP
jgi:hypothetical protein